MDELDNSDKLSNKVFYLETKIKHLTNELRLTREEYKTKGENYYDLYSNMEKKVAERTREVKELHKTLEEKTGQLQIMLDSSPVMIFYKDLKQKYVRVNKIFSKTIGVQIREIIGKSYTELFPGNPGHLFEDDSEVIQTGQAILNRTCYIETPEGQRQILIDKIPYKDIDGKVISIIGFAVDVTDLRKAENEKNELQKKIIRAEKMEAIGLLAGGVAHDGNNILTALSGYLQLIQINIREDDPNREFIEGSLNASKQMEHLINDLLTLTRNVVSNKKIINLNEIISDYISSPVWKNVKKRYPGVIIETKLAPDLSNIRGVPVNLTKVIMNLVINAAEAQPESGNIIISTRNISIEKPLDAYDLSIKKGDFVVLTVTDNGTGIAPDDLNRIFEPFYTKKAMGKSGTGLGMTIVYGIVKDHNGFVDVRSIEGEGTTFELYFPSTEERISEEKKLPVKDYSGSGERILVVDDVKEQREILSEILTRLGYSVITLSSGEKAVEYLKAHSADLLILDMIMGAGYDGFDTYKKILESYPEQRAIIVSGYSKTDRVREAQILGAGQYVKKPYTFEKIGLAVKTELER